MYFRFAHNDFLYALLLVPVLIIIYIITARIRKKALNNFGNFSVISQLMPEVSASKPHLKFIIILLALVILIFAAAGPQFGSKLKEVKRKGIEIILALDVSNSMMAEDIQPNRLERAKQAILTLIDRLENDKIGLIVFAGDAYTQIPITTDYSSARMFLSNINTNIVSRQGTAIGAAIELASKSFSPSTEASKVIVIISDGENHEGNAIEAAKTAADKGIKIFTIGMGSTKGSPIPQNSNQLVQDFRRDNQGNIIMTKLNVQMLSDIARAGEGSYYGATSSRVGLNDLFNKLSRLDKEEIETKVYSEYEEQFHYLVWIAFILLLLEFFIIEKKSRLFSNFNPFKVRL
ncbi:MAG: VWA domain-containing protein [Bacteroidales bacterium]|nr:VWA domain-containing protein [Bacteroidales bacterium]